MKLITALKDAGKYCVSEPVYSLFRVSSRGEYTLICVNRCSPEEFAERVRSESILTQYPDGIEVRCNGVTIQFD
jgi:hypothetical protein